MVLFFRKLLEHLVLNSVPLTPQIITTLGFLFEKEFEYLSPPSSDHLFTLLKTAAGYVMNDTLAAFYHSIMKKFIDSMTESELRQLHSLNPYNDTMFKPFVEDLVKNRILREGCDAFLETAASQAPYWQRIVPRVSTTETTNQDEEEMDEEEVDHIVAFSTPSLLIHSRFLSSFPTHYGYPVQFTSSKDCAGRHLCEGIRLRHLGSISFHSPHCW